MTAAPPSPEGASRPRSSPLARLLLDPRRFRFDALVRIFMRSARQDDPAQAVRFRTPPGLTFPASEVLDVRTGGGGRPDVVVGMFGLTGPSGVLPRYYSEIVTQTLRGGSTALHRFLDMLGERFVAFFALAAIKYHPARSAEVAALRTPPEPNPIARALLSLTGYGFAGTAARLPTGAEPLLHYAGLFALRPRSADRLAAMLTDWLGMTVEVEEYAGAWLRMPPDQRSRIGAGGVFSQLGVDASAGVRAWSPEARILIRIGPLTREGFLMLRPDSQTMRRVVSLIRTFVGMEVGFAINPVLAASEIALPRLDAGPAVAPRLGWDTWLPVSRGGGMRRMDAADAVFDADMIENLPLARVAPL